MNIFNVLFLALVQVGITRSVKVRTSSCFITPSKPPTAACSGGNAPEAPLTADRTVSRVFQPVAPISFSRFPEVRMFPLLYEVRASGTNWLYEPFAEDEDSNPCSAFEGRFRTGTVLNAGGIGVEFW